MDMKICRVTICGIYDSSNIIFTENHYSSNDFFTELSSGPTFQTWAGPER